MMPDTDELPSFPGVTALARIDDVGYCPMYRGRQLRTGRGVAIKLLPAPMDRAGRSQFEAERSRIGRLRQVAAILQVDEVEALSDGRPYLVSELCAESMAGMIRRGERVEPERAAELGRVLADALAQAHELEIVHGSVTPRNVLFRRDGQPALSDFGVALRRMYATDPGDEYAAPETLRDGSLTIRTDLYGLGATLYTALMGEPPFPARIGEHPSERILRVIGRPAPRLDDTVAPAGLALLLAELMATSPEDRPGDAAAVADRFNTALASGKDRGVDGHRMHGRRKTATTPAEEPSDESADERDPADATADSPRAETSTDWSGLLDDVLHDEPTGDPHGMALPPTPPSSRSGRRTAVALALAIAAAIVVAAVLAGGHRTARHPTAQPRATAATRSVPAAAGSPGPAVQLVSVRDSGTSVLLTWSGPPMLSYAVVVAQPGQRSRVVLAHHARSLRARVTPGLQYCFLIQATDGRYVVETDPRPIRDAVCRT